MSISTDANALIEQSKSEKTVYILRTIAAITFGILGGIMALLSCLLVIAGLGAALAAPAGPAAFLISIGLHLAALLTGTIAYGLLKLAGDCEPEPTSYFNKVSGQFTSFINKNMSELCKKDANIMSNAKEITNLSGLDKLAKITSVLNTVIDLFKVADEPVADTSSTAETQSAFGEPLRQQIEQSSDSNDPVVHVHPVVPVSNAAQALEPVYCKAASAQTDEASPAAVAKKS